MITLQGKARPPTDEDRAITERRLVPYDPSRQPPPLEESPDNSFLRLAVQQPQPIDPQPIPGPKPGTQTKFRTSLKLTPDQETAMVSRAIRRIDEVNREMGLDFNGYVMPNSWMAIRQRNQSSFDGDFSWRALLGGIFSKSNFSLNTNTRHTRYLSARVQDDLMGTSPFFAAIAKSGARGNAELARQVEELVQGDIERSDVRSGIRQAQKTALIRNETVVKTTYHSDTSPYRGPATVLVNEMGEPILTPDKKLYILEDDNFFPHPQVEGLSMLEKDPSFLMAEGQFAYQFFPDLEQTLVLYEGVRSEPIDYRCFGCPLKVKSIHEADINFHLYNIDPDRLRERYAGIDVADNYFGWWDLTGVEIAKTAHGELDERESNTIPKASIAEVYMRFDADGDGKAEEIILLIDRRSSKPIFYDYLANHFNKRPFEVIVGLEDVPDRWYGRGIFSLGEDQELHMDAEFNRAQVKGARSSSVTFRVKDAVEEWNNGIPVVIGTDDIYDLRPGFDAKSNPPIFKINLAEENSDALELMEISRQASDALIGVVSSADASQSDMNQSKTATGILNLQASGDVITKATEGYQTIGITAILKQVVDCCLEHMDKARIAFSKDGTQLSVLSIGEIRSLDKNVTLTLTRSRSTQLMNTSERAIAIAKDFRGMMMTDPEGAKIMRPLYIAQLKALEINDADEICPEVTDEYIAAFHAQQQAQAQLQAQQQQPPQKQLSNGS